MTEGKKYILKEPLKTLCCSHIIPSGTEIKLAMISSKNRVYIVADDSGGHKVKYSSLKRVTGNNNEK